uniref:Chitin-binding type-2 domain-containing protein n=1 Tax=Lygus hesperus TaxID=30085 RepID=A0A146KKI6_LYGHE
MKILLWIAFAIGWVETEAQSVRRNFFSQTNMPVTSFSCRDKILGGYYADPETDCQMFHVCVKVPGQGIQDYKFLCPNNTSFDQENQICDDWFNIDCEASTLFYSDNFDLYRIGSDYDTGRVSPGVKLPTNNINNAVSDPDDDYLRRADRGESVGNDLLRGSHSSNFFSNKNQGREDEEEVKKKPPSGKSAVRKLLTGKRPVPSTTSAQTPQPTQAAPVDTATQRQNFAGRNRGASNYRGSFRSYNNQPQQQQPTSPAEPQKVNYNTAAPSTQKPSYYTTPAPATQRQNFYTTPAQTQRPNYYTTAPPTQRPTYYTTQPPTPAQRQNFYTAAPAAQTQRQNNYYSPPVTQQQPQQQVTGTQGFTAGVQNQYYNPSTQNQAFNNYQTSTTRNYQNYQTTQAPVVYTETTNYAATNDYTRATNNNYETAKLFKSNVAAQSNPNYYNANYNADKFDDGSSGEFLKTAPSQNLGTANFNRIQNIYKGFNTSVAASYNTEAVNATTLRPAVNHFSNYATINRNNYVNTSPKPAYNQYSTNYNQEQTYSTVAPNYFSQSTTQKPFVQASYNGTTASKNNYYNSAVAGNTQAQNTYNPTTQYNYYTTTTQKPVVSSQNYYQTSQQYTQSSPNYYTTTTQKPVQNVYNPSAPAQPTGFYNQGTTQAQNYYNQQGNPAKAAVQKPNNQKKYSSPAVSFSPAQSTPAPFRGGNVANRGTPIPDKTEKPRPFTTTVTPPAQETKSEKDQYDYAYYDDATHTEYDSLDTVEFVKTKSKTRSRK